ncbi:hypothetical protein GN956_G3225 [Arapaima gigas]
MKRWTGAEQPCINVTSLSAGVSTLSSSQEDLFQFSCCPDTKELKPSAPRLDITGINLETQLQHFRRALCLCRHGPLENWSKPNLTLQWTGIPSRDKPVIKKASGTVLQWASLLVA